MFVNTSPGLCDISLGDNKRKWESPVSTTFGKRWPPLGSPHHQRKRSPKKFLHFLLNGTVSQGYRSLFYFMNLQYSNRIGLLGHLKLTAKMKQLLKVLGMFFREKKKTSLYQLYFFLLHILLICRHFCKLLVQTKLRTKVLIGMTFMYSTVECTPPLLPTEKKHIYG